MPRLARKLIVLLAPVWAENRIWLQSREDQLIKERMRSFLSHRWSRRLDKQQLSRLELPLSTFSAKLHEIKQEVITSLRITPLGTKISPKSKALTKSFSRANHPKSQVTLAHSEGGTDEQVLLIWASRLKKKVRTLTGQALSWFERSRDEVKLLLRLRRTNRLIFLIACNP